MIPPFHPIFLLGRKCKFHSGAIQKVFFLGGKGREYCDIGALGVKQFDSQDFFSLDSEFDWIEESILHIALLQWTWSDLGLQDVFFFGATDPWGPTQENTCGFPQNRCFKNCL